MKIKEIITMLPPYQALSSLVLTGTYSREISPRTIDQQSFQYAPFKVDGPLALVTLEEEKPNKQYVQLRVAKGGEINNENKEK